ncbi:protein PHOX1-like [Musa acuminata AAA Group]|uniref:protein PHOX1-like n=1 Tax=Musa acuminata AAA Group TaxID=214697 RepID=UPI0031DEDA2A
MGKPRGKKKKNSGGKNGTESKHARSNEHNPKVFGEGTTIFLDMAHDMKEEGNKLFQKRDYEGALLKYENAIKLFPKNHANIAYLHSNIATCYMQMEPKQYHRAIKECNLALEASPKYSKALLKRARCLEALSRLDLACKDVDVVLNLEPNNITALEISERVKKVMEKKGFVLDDNADLSLTEVVAVKEKLKKKKKKKKKKKRSHKAEEKVITEEKHIDVKEQPMWVVKLVFAEDIRWAQIPANCSMLRLRETVGRKFQSLKAILIKYRDREGDLVTITTSEELTWARQSAEPQGSVRLYLTEVSPECAPWFEDAETNSSSTVQGTNHNVVAEYHSIMNDEEKSSPTYVDDWIIQFAHLFKNYLGFSSDSYVNLRELGMKLSSEAIEDTITSEEAQEIFELAEGNFQDMAALALFNWGNIHLSRARKKLFLSEDASKESIHEKMKDAYEWAQDEYIKAGKRYKDALKIKPDFYEGFLALGLQQFERAKLSWCHVLGSKVDLEAWASEKLIELYNNAEDNMEKGTNMWEKMEEQRIKELSELKDDKSLLEKMGLDGFFKDLSMDETAEQAANMRSQINRIWGTILYERSVMEFKLGIPIWEEFLVAAVEKFKLAGVSPVDIAVITKNHCANRTSQEGSTFMIEEIVQAWHETHDDKRWMIGVPFFRLEQLFRRRV